MAALPPNYSVTIDLGDSLASIGGQDVVLTAAASQMVQVVSASLVTANLAAIGAPGSVPALPPTSGSGQQADVYLRGDNSWQGLPEMAFTASPFTVPAIGGTVVVTLFAPAAWATVRSDTYYSDGTHRGFMSVTANGGSTSITLHNNGNANAGDVVALNARVKLIGAGIVTATQSGLVPYPPNDATKVLRGDGAFGTLAYASLSGGLVAATSTSAGLVPTPPNDATRFLDGTASFSVPSLNNLTSTAWTAFTATLTPSAGAITTQSSSSAYLRMGKTVFFNLGVTCTTFGTASGSTTIGGLPFPVKRQVEFFTRDTGLTGIGWGWTIIASATSGLLQKTNDNSYPTWANGVAYTCTGVYETT